MKECDEDGLVWRTMLLSLSLLLTLGLEWRNATTRGKGKRVEVIPVTVASLRLIQVWERWPTCLRRRSAMSPFGDPRGDATVQKKKNKATVELSERQVSCFRVITIHCVPSAHRKLVRGRGAGSLVLLLSPSKIVP